MKKIILLFAAAWLGLCPAEQVLAETFDTPQMRRAAPKKIPVPRPQNEWDFMRSYHQLVILIEFSDTTFSMPDPQDYYDHMLNGLGINQGAGPGCAAEYLYDQSQGLFHPHFDVFGPLRIDLKAKRSYYYNYGMEEKMLALDSLFAAFPDIDYSIYDWNGDGMIEQVMYICAGPSANHGGGFFVWPNTDYLPFGKQTPDGLKIDQHSITCEEPHPDAPGGTHGFATLLHEFSHAIGLPDVYPTGGLNSSLYSVADEWDLMDGGNFTNYGWCPPNYTAPELMYLNWLTPVELTSDTTITGLKPVADGGKAYLIRHTENEYLMLENRQQTGWDYGIPGHGLTIWHVDFDSTLWKTNELNNESLRMSMYYADNMNYNEWRAYYKANKSLFDGSLYALNPMLRSHYLSSAAYPWRTDSTEWVNNCLSEDSTPALVMYHPNGQGSTSLGKRITNIEEASDGTVSFTIEDTSVPSNTANAQRDDVPCTKVFRDGMLLIDRNGRTYTVTGAVVK